jgi:osmotically-inducible protein OsmY
VSLKLFKVSEIVPSRLRPHDRAIRETVDRVLRETGYAPLRNIRCDVSDGVVELTGSVPSFCVKQLAQTAVLRLEQIRGVKNLLRVA